MKKFLSLVLAAIMTLSLVTISAGATEYKDLTDKDEIRYEEAVAVLNRIGVITGYDDGSFRPETELTRGAAAKIIVSLLIGPEAASNLPNTYAPYPDVPANHTFAGVISYCKTAGIISGYGDGTFKPANSLTGYAFAKMLLGAIGYDSAIQGYTDTGWTMNVARDGNAANLFNRIEFDGAAAVNRETACQLALNTLKATMVEYTGGIHVTAGDATVTSMPTLAYKTSNQAYAKNISNRKLNTAGNVEVNNHWTVEFGEEHFKDLRLNDEHGTANTTTTNRFTGNMARDQFGRPSNVWSFKKVTIGTFPIEPDFTYTTQVTHNVETVTDANKVRALGLNGYELYRDETTKANREANLVDTALYMNGDEKTATEKVTENQDWTLKNIADIADMTDNGTVVEVYVDEDDADFINTVVVVKTQLMEVKTIKSEAVSLKLYDDGSDASGVDNGDVEAAKKGILYGYNQKPIDEDVNDVEINDECYKTLSGMKAGDIVAVIPVWTADNSKYDVAAVYTPETVSGELTRVDTYGTNGKGPNAIKATVGGTAYNVALWNKDLYDIDGTKIRVTDKDITLFLDQFGNAMLAKNVGATSNYMIVGAYHSGIVDGAVVTFVDGWDISGNELSLNIGNINYDTKNDGKNDNTAVTPYENAFPIGSLVRYTSATTSRYAEWELNYLGVFDVARYRVTKDAEGKEVVDLAGDAADPYNLKASNGRVLLNNYITGFDADGNPVFNQSRLLREKRNDGPVAEYNGAGAAYDAAMTRNVDTDDKGIKVIYVTMDPDDKEVDSIEIKSGMQSITNEEILGKDSGFAHKRAQACVNLKDNAVNGNSVVKAIVIKRESGSANLSDLVYVSNYAGSANKNAKAIGAVSSKPVYGYLVHFIGSDNWEDEVTIYTTTNLSIGDFARARKDSNVPDNIEGVTEDNFYRTTKYGGQGTNEKNRIHMALSVLSGVQLQKILGNNKTLLKLMNYYNGQNPITATPKAAAVGADVETPNIVNTPNIAGTYYDSDKYLDIGAEAAYNLVSIRKAKIIDLSGNGISSADDLKEVWNNLVKKEKNDNRHPLITMSLAFNDKWDSDDFRAVYALVITKVDTNGTKGYDIPDSDITVPVTPEGPAANTDDVVMAKGLDANIAGTLADGGKVTTLGNGQVLVNFTLKAPTWAYTASDELVDKSSKVDLVRIKYEIHVTDADGKNEILWAYGVGNGTAAYLTDAADAAKGLTKSGSSFTLSNWDITKQVSASALDGRKVKIVITDVDWRLAKVEYTLNGKAADDMMNASNTAFYMATYTDQAPATTFAVDGDVANGAYKGQDGTWSIVDGVDTSNADTEDYTDVAAKGSSLTKQQNIRVGAEDGQFVAAKGKVVKIALKTTASVTEMFTVKVDGTANGSGVKKSYSVPEYATNMLDRGTQDSTNKAGYVEVSIKTNNSDPATYTVAENDTFWYVIKTGECDDTGLMTGFVIHAQIKRDDGAWTDLDPMTVKVNDYAGALLPVTDVHSDVDFKIKSIDIVYSQPAPVKVTLASEKKLVIEFTDSIELKSTNKVEIAGSLSTGSQIATLSVSGKVLTVEFEQDIYPNASGLTISKDILTCGTQITIILSADPLAVKTVNTSI